MSYRGQADFVAWSEKPTRCHSRFRGNDINSHTIKPKRRRNDIDIYIYQMLSKNDSVKEIFSRFSGKYRINRIIDNYGYGEGVAYFLLKSLNELIYKEELQIHYHDYDYQIYANQEYRYIFKNSNITKYFIAPEKSLFYQLKFVDADRVYSNDLENWDIKRGGEYAQPILNR
ncbi:hypothetical protein MCC_05690 [Rickettsia rhipicephali str. 3-7-female6-CWPP]|uniref:DUF6314 domain-containing protein n=2 Tax=Rickettsia rhipicephali TaxID=33992 RepID=A0AAI8AAA2_RICR3|nr:DUF6314 family protein [Rickettsia rhipicephali]AFC72647.1 hypothetical protein MCC_05690 [Rickettsia rhipicephali str. 3-7-female6-CWPP]